jgi:hypothetical protein
MYFKQEVTLATKSLTSLPSLAKPEARRDNVISSSWEHFFKMAAGV